MGRSLTPMFVLLLLCLACAGRNGAPAATDDDAGPGDDDASPACVEGARRCTPQRQPEVCQSGAWAAAEPCAAMQYCNFGECAVTLIDLPADESPHADMVEWWYWNGNLTDAAGRRYGFELTFFYGGSLFGIDAWMVQAAITDETADAHRMSVRYQLAKPQIVPGAVDFTAPNASADGSPANGYRLQGTAEDASFDLALTAVKGPAYHGGNGSVRMSSRTCDSFYYSRTRLDAAGTLTIGGQTFAVSGQSWMDHQWGNFVISVMIGWDWYSMQFSDNTEIMYFVFRGSETDPRVIDMALGTYVDANGDQTILSENDVKATPLGHWHSDVTGGDYPQNWNFQAPSLGLNVDLVTKVADQEMPNLMWNYWEGSVRIDGIKNDAPIDGLGYVELSGYAGRPIAWFLFPDDWGNGG